MNSTSTTGSVMNLSAVPEGCVTPQFFPVLPWDNRDSLIPKQADTVVSFVLSGLCMPLLFLVSFITNLISMTVFYKLGLKERINASLFTLSLMDLMSVSVVYAHNSDAAYMFAIGRAGDLGPVAQFLLDNFVVGLHGLVTSSQLTYTVIALERCLCVTHPLLVKGFMSSKTTVVGLWTMAAVVTGVSVLVMGVRYSILCVFDQRDGTVTYASYPRDLYFRHKRIMDVMYSMFLGLFLPGLSLISVSVCTIIMAVKLKQLTRWREKASSAAGNVSSRDLATTRIIIGTSILFIVCIIPAIVMRASFLTVPGLQLGGRYDNLAWLFRRFYHLFSAINNTFNFFVYYTYGSRFRETTRGLFSFCCRG